MAKLLYRTDDKTAEAKKNNIYSILKSFVKRYPDQILAHAENKLEVMAFATSRFPELARRVDASVVRLE